MSNDDLAKAIQFANERIGAVSADDPRWRLWIDHLKLLMAEQVRRAASETGGEAQ